MHIPVERFEELGVLRAETACAVDEQDALREDDAITQIS